MEVGYNTTIQLGTEKCKHGDLLISCLIGYRTRPLEGSIF